MWDSKYNGTLKSESHTKVRRSAPKPDIPRVVAKVRIKYKE